MEDHPDNPIYITYLSRLRESMFADSVVVEFQKDRAKYLIMTNRYRSVIPVGMTTKDHTIKQISIKNHLLLIAHDDGELGSNKTPGGMKNEGLGKVIHINPEPFKNELGYWIPRCNKMGAMSPAGPCHTISPLVRPHRRDDVNRIGAKCY